MKTKMILAGLIAAALSLQAQSFSYTDYIKVDKSKPMHKQVTKRIPYQECWDEQVPIYERLKRHSSHDNTVGSLIGGVAGGILGHQIGGGSGKTAATVGGAIIGTLVGHNLSNRDRDHRYENDVVTYRTKRQCVTRYKESVEEKFVGFKNVGFYKGQKIVTFSDHKIHRIPVTVTINY